jgi:hypothetical protein
MAIPASADFASDLRSGVARESYQDWAVAASLLLDALRHGMPVHARQADVEHDDVWVVGFDHSQGIPPIAGSFNIVPVKSEQIGRGHCTIFQVLDQEHAQLSCNAKGSKSYRMFRKDGRARGVTDSV